LKGAAGGGQGCCLAAVQWAAANVAALGGGRLRRAILVFLLGVCVFGAAALGGFFAASQLAPERLRAEAEARLSTLLKAPVRLKAVSVSLTEDLPWLHLTARGLRADPLPGGASLAVDELSARIDPMLLILGRLELRALRFSGIELAVPEASGEPADPNVDPLTRAVAVLSRAGEQLRSRPCPIPPVDGERLALSLTSAAAPRRVLELDALSFRCSTLTRDGVWQANGRGLLASGATAPFTLELRAADDEVEAKLALTSAPLGPLLSALGQPPELSGEISGDLSWRSLPGAPHALRLGLTGREVRGVVSEASDPKRAFRLELRAPRAVIALAASERELRTSQLALSDGAIALDGSLALGLPLRDASALRAEVVTREIGRAELVRIAAQLPRGVQPDVESALARIVSGKIRTLDVKLASTVGGAREISGGALLARKGDLTLKVALEGAELRIGESDRLRDVTGTLAFAGNELEVQALGARFRERRLPRLSLKLRGLERVRSVDDIRCERPAPVTELAGIDDLRAWIDSRRKPPYTASWSTLELDVDRLAHPLLFCTLEDAVAEVRRLDNGYDYAIESGTWAGYAVEGSAAYRKARGKDGQPLRDGGSITLELALGEKRLAAPALRASAEAPAQPASAASTQRASWAEGRFAIDVRFMGRFLTKGYDGDFRALGSRIELLRTKLHLAPTGELEGRFALELGGDGPVPFEADAQSRGLELLDVWKTSQAPKTLMSGTLTGGASVSGRLHLGRSPLVDVSGYASLHARKGEIYRDVPFLLALAMTDEKINPFGKRNKFPYRGIDLEGPIENGWMTSRTLTLEGKSERMAASGKTHLSEPYELQAAIGMYPIPTIDQIVGAIPIVNVLLLGEDQALAGFYFSVTGVWTKPVVTPLVAKSVASGPASLVLEGVPNFLFGSLKAIGEVLAPPEAAKKEAAEKAEGAAVQPQGGS